MIQSVQRAFRIVEALDAAGSDGATLGALSSGCGLKAPTAHNVLSTLIELGYARQDTETRRYALGPRAAGLGTGQAMVSRLQLAASPAVTRLHECVNETVILTVDLGQKRHSILSRESAHPLRVGASTGVDDHFYDTATGRVLLSQCDDAALSRFIAAQGLPGDSWPRVSTLAELNSRLSAIRCSGHARVDKSGSHVRALAVPVHPPGFAFRVALGLYYPTVRGDRHDDEVLVARLQEAADEIEHVFERM